MPTTVTCSSVSHCRSCNSAPVVAAKVLICCRRPPRGPGTRTPSGPPCRHPARRTAPPEPPSPHSFPSRTCGDGPGGRTGEKETLSHVLEATVTGACRAAAASGYESGSRHQCGTTSPARRHTHFHPARAARQGRDRLRGEAQANDRGVDQERVRGGSWWRATMVIVVPVVVMTAAAVLGAHAAGGCRHRGTNPSLWPAGLPAS